MFLRGKVFWERALLRRKGKSSVWMMILWFWPLTFASPKLGECDLKLIFLLSSSKATWIYVGAKPYESSPCVDTSKPPRTVTSIWWCAICFICIFRIIQVTFSNYRFHVPWSGEHLLSVRFYREVHSDKNASVVMASIGLVGERFSCVSYICLTLAEHLLEGRICLDIPI